ncbi:uncharacterized protein LOC124311039 isoform X2 [Daphnia pulicaria]|uniref:uncharacterized protein LOC124311039 isoform X2 n=1 Tax=Daphnia pulicaria TaxID=35523 RepID=UPI001EEC3F24|nr:uncharacterized protein LOC124311039 isoform X2 [Daphnia pulicaria]
MLLFGLHFLNVWCSAERNTQFSLVGKRSLGYWYVSFRPNFLLNGCIEIDFLAMSAASETIGSATTSSLFASNTVVPADVRRNAWIAVDITPPNGVVDRFQTTVNKFSSQFSRPRSLSQSAQKEKFSLLLQLWKRFARTTTGHGFARMVDSDEPKSIRIFWVVVIVLLISGLFISIVIISYEVLVVRGLRREFIVQHNITMFLPDIHICDTSLFNPKALQEMGINNTMASYLALALSHLLASRAIMEDMEKQTRLNNEFRRLTQNLTTKEIFDRTTLGCEDIILGCTHDRILYSGKDCCTKFFGNRRFVTNLATICVSTHFQPLLEEIFDTQIYGFTVYLKTNVVGRFEFDSTIISSNVASRRGIIYAVSDSITAVNPTISTFGRYIDPGTWTSVSISLTRTDNTELQKGLLSTHSCVSPDSPDHLYLVPNHNVYSQRNCVFSATRTILEAKLNCSLFRFNRMGPLETCYPNVMIDVHSPELANEIKQKIQECPEDCISDNYHVSSSTTHLDLGDHDDMHSNEKHNDHILHSALQFYYSSFSFTVIKNHPESLVKWLSDVGGNMSLYLGASLVTLLEMIVLLFRCTRKCIRRKMGKQNLFTQSFDSTRS